MTITLKIPEITDASIQALSDNLNAKVNEISQKVAGLESKISQLQAGGSIGNGGGNGPGSPPPPPARKTGPGAPPPPPGRPGAAGGPGSAPANPMSLRGSIMDELKTLFSKRKG